MLLDLTRRGRRRQRLDPRLEGVEAPAIGAQLGERCRRKPADARLDRLDAVFLERVGEEPRVNFSRPRAPLGDQLLKPPHPSARADSSADDVTATPPVR